MHNGSKMEVLTLLFILLISCNGLFSTKQCDFYKRALKDNPQTTGVVRKFMNCWGDEVEHGQSDLILLIDKSGSMRQSGWNSAIDFVDALLTEVKIAFNATRVAVGTFATKHEVELNYLYEPTAANHKCRFVRDFKSVTYSSRNMGSLTNMKGSLKDAHNIFLQMINNPTKHKLRQKANKVVMVLSDGYPNTEIDGSWNWGVSLDKEILDIRQIGFVEVYAVAVTSGSNENLMKNKIATDPSLYIYKPTFNDLTKLAKSIRGDPYEHDYETFRVLATECKEGCDANADCGCNLRSGKFKCACKRGFYGTAEKRTSGASCHPCAVDTYGKKVGFTTGCTPCPSNSGTNGATGKLEVADCSCKLGFTGNPSRGIPCTKVKCNPVNKINNGFIDNPVECSKNEYGATCIFRCNSGFKLEGNDVLTCDHTGVFSGSTPQCVPLRCSAASTAPTTSYTVSCTGILDTATNTYGVGEKCTYSCKDQYYHSNGTLVRECLHSEEWSGSLVVCKEIACPKIPKVHEKLFTESPNVKCFEETTKVGEVCRFNCPTGYEFSGSRSVTCTKDTGAIGVWRVGASQFVSPNCKDIERPKFSKNDECQNGITITNTTVIDKSYGLINFDAIGVTDNSGEEVVVASSPAGYELGRSYRIGITKLRQPLAVTFTATDKSNNTANCRFFIEIQDKQPPKLLKCPPSNIERKTSASKIRVMWEEPQYSDNCGNYSQCKIDILSSTPSNSEFQQGSTTKITYKALDPSGNVNEKCIFNVIIKAPTCSPLPPPRNGMVAQFTETFATVSCPNDQGLYPTENLPFFYLCQSQQWVPNPPNPLAKQLVPDCIAKTPPTGFNQYLFMMYSYQGDCSSTAAQASVKQQLITLCGGKCNIDGVKVRCGAADAVRRRKRSNIKQLTMEVTIKVTTTADKAAQDLDGDKMKQEMSTFAPTVLQTMKSIPTQSLDPHITGSPSGHSTNQNSLTCAGIGEIYDSSNIDKKQRCAGCMAGQFKNLTSGLCQACPKGTYQPNEGATSCITCPEGSTTIAGDVKNYTSCRQLCNPGEYSASGFAPCDSAPRGTYVEGKGKTSYTSCPSGTTTMTEGAKSRFNCGTKCQPGTYSETGVEPCSPCEQGSYQNDIGKVNCIDCPGLKWTYGEGADDLSKCVDINSCSSNPCMNEGHCIDLKVSFRCECKAGFWGRRCEKEIDECSLHPCLNGGKCLDKFKGYMCICPAGATGKHCETLYGICQTGVCGANGICMDLADNSYKCVCKDGYTGSFCETFIDACQSAPCKNDGVCESQRTDYTCKCKSGFTGKRCETNLNFCASGPCQNGGECSDSKYGFICKCNAPYYGIQCEKKTNMCQHTICQHSVKCTDLGTDVKCSCLPGYGGKYCDTKLGSDFDIGFQNREAPTFSSVEGKYDLSTFTIAFWMRTSDLYNKGTPISYANQVNGKVDDNALVIADYSDFDLTINNATANLDFSANDGEWHHIAVTWSSASGIWIAYKDGAEIKRATTPLQQGKTIKKGGMFVIGEEQDEIGGSFTPTESFFGDMSQMNVWKRVLSPNEVYDLAMSCKHAAGDVLAWADFSEDSHGNIMKTEPSLACDFSNTLREYQVLKGWQLPSQLRAAIATESHQNAKSCAVRCSSSSFAARCRSFAHDEKAGRCIFYSKSLLIAGGEAEKSTQYDLYQFSCVKPLGLSDDTIANHQMSSSSSVSGSAPYMARLFNTPTSASQTYAHWSPNDNNPYIQINLGSKHKITGIASQGHFRSDVKEFATSYRIEYRATASSQWISYESGKSFTANTDSQTVKRNEVFFFATVIRLRPRSTSSRIAMRLEIYGCPNRPQGQPVARSDGNNCHSSTCFNGGTCIDLYQRYVCTCPIGFTGTRCQNAAPCPQPDIPVFGKIKSLTSTAAEVECLPNYETSDNTRKSCVRGSWNGAKVTCRPKNDCKSSPCFQNHCQELESGYRCYCPAGYKLAADGYSCQDINECNVNNGGCNHGCTNTVGSFRCVCRGGYRLEGSLLCVDNDECQNGRHGCSQDCKNTLGGYKCLCKTGYALNSNGRDCDQRLCPSIPNIANGHVSRAAKQVSYTCNAGYQLNGPQVRNCLPDGKWSGTQPSCKRVFCGDIAGETAIVSVSGSYYNSVARFSCPLSYRLLGSATRTCLQSGQWSNSHPRCTKSTCPKLSNPLNGKILGISTISGSVARVKCNTGYRLVQSNLELRTCQNNGQWTGGNSAVATCELIDCGSPPSSPYLHITTLGGTKYQATASYTCSQSGGQRCLDGPSKRHCNADGKWSGAQPKCVAKSCCKPMVPEHSKLYSDNRYNYGDKVYTRCDEGYVTGGTALRDCQNNGQWSGSQTTCTIKNCGDPGTVTNGVRMMEKTTYGSSVSYFCNPSYMLVGSRKRVCQANGQWSGEATSCSKSNCGGKLTQSGTVSIGGGKKVCHWLIQVNQGKKVNIDFTSFNLGANDKVKIYDGQKYVEYVTFTSKKKPRPVTSNSHYMRVIYIGEENNGGGFTLKFKEATCGGHLDSEFGVITSPGFPVSYNPNDECFWTIYRQNQNLQLAFTDFYLQKNPTDFVEVYEGPFQNSRMLLYKAFGYSKPLVEWADRWMWVHFKVDGQYQDDGFKGVYGMYNPPSTQ